ncbi:MAG: TfoX/Sxy family protein [Bryobacteraceae bacterium]
MAYDLGLADRVLRVVSRSGPVVERKMFGGISYMVNGHMCCGVVNTDLVLRLTPDAVAAALKKPHTRPMDFTGKPMKSMIYVSAAGLERDDQLEKWVGAAATCARSLPPKE